MSILSKFFKSSQQPKDPDIQFGRFTDTFKPDEKYQSWDKSIENFDNEKYLTSYRQFLDFLTIDGLNNVIYNVHSGKITFSIFQGSKVITGEADFTKFRAEAKIVQAPQPALGMMRMLLEENFNLKYSRYALDDEYCICLRFDTYVEDGSPHKLYHALKELATEADRKDDVLLDKFDGLSPINFNHTRRPGQHEINTKYKYLVGFIREVLQEIDHGKLNSYVYPGGISYILLDLIYKIDYLIKPEGRLMESIRECHTLYFEDNVTNVQEKNQEIICRIRHIENTKVEELAKELYEVKSTFGISVPEGHQRLIEIIDAQMTDFDWYYSNKYEMYAQAICGYVVGFSLYSYSLPEPSKELLALYFKIMNADYFAELGFANTLKSSVNFHSKNILKEIKSIIRSHQDRYPGVKVNYNNLVFDDNCQFARSYLNMVRHIEFRENQYNA